MPGNLGGRGNTVGGLRHRVRVQAPVESANESRERVVTGWTTVAELWARVEPVAQGSGEQVQGDMVQATAAYVVTLRTTAHLPHDGSPKLRLLWLRSAGDLVLNITAVTQIEGDQNFAKVWCKREA